MRDQQSQWPLGALDDAPNVERCSMRAKSPVGLLSADSLLLKIDVDEHGSRMGHRNTTRRRVLTQHHEPFWTDLEMWRPSIAGLPLCLCRPSK
jgi:hypothetical protein